MHTQKHKAGSRSCLIMMILLAISWMGTAESYGSGAGKPGIAKSPGAGAGKSKTALSSVKVELISPQEAKVLADIGVDPVMVDTRSEEAFKKLHIIGAVNLPWKKVIDEPAKLPRNRILVLYGDSADDVSSGDVANQLIREWGYTEVKVLKTGLNGWICQDFPTEGDTTPNSCQ
jgi:rhodanese-related sulfurtransferase